MWNPDDPVRNVEVRNETAKAETQREAAKLPQHVQHDPCMSADAALALWHSNRPGSRVRSRGTGGRPTAPRCKTAPETAGGMYT